MPKTVALLPVPATLRLERGEWTADKRVTIAADTRLSEAAELAADLFRACGREVDLAFDPVRGDVRFVHSTASDQLGSEGYRLRITSNGVLVTATSPVGAFYAVQSLRQLLPVECEDPTKTASLAGRPLGIPCLEIKDAPRFPWRGVHLDVSRHFYPAAEVKRLIDLAALHKLNRFHWHLTDDQGWRIEIKAFPELGRIGAWRGERERYGGFYTQAEVKEIVAYAAARFVTVIPEIEMPGHARAALACYPQLSCRGTPVPVWTDWGVSSDVFCAGNDEVISFLERVLDEVAELFPSNLIHIGGDECPKERWHECPRCQARIRDEKLANEHELQSWFVRKIQQHVMSLGKQIIGWDEILEGGLAPGAVVMSWRGLSGGIEAAAAGNQAVMSPESHCYLDHKQTMNPGELGPVHFNPPVITLEHAYSFEPIPEELGLDASGSILGAQANIWTEAIPDRARFDYMVFPRLCALSEVMWSIVLNRDWNSFKQRLRLHAERLDALHVGYCHILESL